MEQTDELTGYGSVLPERLFITNMTSTSARLFYCSPRPPAKSEGRRGTRRAWKRDNPPGVYWVVTESTRWP